MQRSKEETRRHLLKLAVSPRELARITKELTNTTFRTRADFFRSRIFGDPETVFYRNQSLDEFLPLAVPLKNELTGIVKAIRESLSQLSTPDKPGDPVSVFPELQRGLLTLESKVDELRLDLIKIYEQCVSEYHHPPVSGTPSTTTKGKFVQGRRN